MKGLRYFAPVAALALAAQPCAAAKPFEAAQYNHVSSAFAGATLKVGMNRNKQEAPGIQLGLGISQTLRYLGSGTAIQVPGIELGLIPTQTPKLLIGGRAASSLDRRLGLSTGAAIAAVAGLAAGALVVGSLSGGGSREDESDRRQCLLPERELCR